MSVQSLNGDSYQGAQVGANVQSQVGTQPLCRQGDAPEPGARRRSARPAPAQTGREADRAVETKRYQQPNQNKGNHCGGGARPHFVSAFALARGPRPEVRRGAGAAEAGEQVGPAGGASVHFVH